MNKKIQLLDCTLRDGAYIVQGKFGVPALRGIVKKLQDAHMDIVECGWLKNEIHQEGTSFFHIPDDMKFYFENKQKDNVLVAMIDWDRYNIEFLPPCDDNILDAIRVVFPHGKCKEGIEVGQKIAQKGYKIFYQVANTLGYSDEELEELVHFVNLSNPECLSIVDTFGAMYPEDLTRIADILDSNLNPEIKLGFHSHNNQQLSFALSIHFIEQFMKRERKLIIDSSLCGMGRGAGNTPTELIAGYLNRKYAGNYDMNIILDTIDMYMGDYQKNFNWGYSTPYFIAGMYCSHVNNIAYLLDNHRTSAKDMKGILDSLSIDERRKYDYDLLEKAYIEYQSKIVDDDKTTEILRNEMKNRNILLLSPGKSVITQKKSVVEYMRKYNPIVIGINAILSDYQYDYMFFSNKIRYKYAHDIYPKEFSKIKHIITSNIKTDYKENEYVVNFNTLIKRGWEHFDNSIITCLRLMNKLCVKYVAIAGFDGFSTNYADSYADGSLPCLYPSNKWDDLNDEIEDMFNDFMNTTGESMEIFFVTESKYHKNVN